MIISQQVSTTIRVESCTDENDAMNTALAYLKTAWPIHADYMVCEDWWRENYSLDNGVPQPWFVVVNYEVRVND